MIKLDPNSELARRADEIRAAAKSCVTLIDLANAFGWHIQTARHANQALELGLPEKALRPAAEKHVGVAHPKPTKRAGK